jgi:hypothetical protein
MENTLIGTRYQTNGVFYDKILTYSGRIQNAPVLPSTCAFKREVWTELGGLDRRFPGAFCNADMILRFYERGYNLFIAPDCWLNEIRNNEVQSSWWKKTGKRGQMICNTFWVKDGLVVRKRLKPVLSFDDENILTVDQFKRN